MMSWVWTRLCYCVYGKNFVNRDKTHFYALGIEGLISFWLSSQTWIEHIITSYIINKIL